MAKLTAKARSALPKAAFAGPVRTFPIQNKAHARAAISGATRSERAGNIGQSTEATIKAKASAELEHPQSHAAFIKLGAE